MAYIVGVDTGGTFTDCVVIAGDGSVTHDKALTTPEDLTLGVLQSVGNTAALLGLSARDLLSETQVFAHGTTAGVNALISRTGAKVGLLTTKGHEDAILIGRVHQKVEGLSEREIIDVARLEKADPLVPRPLIKGLDERVDYKGGAVVALDLDQAREAVRALVAEGVQAIAVSFLWSFMNPAHEQAVQALIRADFPGLFVTISSDLAPVMGEYERTATTVINAHVGPKIEGYMLALEGKLRAAGLTGQFLAMQALGGAIPAAEAARRAVNILSSGPVGGAIGSAFLGRTLDYPNVITTDVGGTSFDVGLVVEGEARYADRPVFEKYALLTPMIDVTSIGAGGGSIAWVEPETGLLQVGPRSAGSNPGPVCYGRGGTEPTVTDADLVLGRINPEHFFGGRLRLDAAAAECAIRERVAEPLGMSAVEAARGIVDIADAHMADLVRKVSIENGYDPRDFVLFAYGGGGPLHVGAYAADIGVRSVVISPYAPVFSAFGIAGADVVRFYQKSYPAVFPLDPAIVNQIFAELEAQAQEEAGGGAGEPALELQRQIDLRFRRQTHELRVAVPRKELSAADLDQLVDQFEADYERLFGRGTGYRRAGVEVSTFRVRCVLRLPKPALRAAPADGADASHAQKGTRPVFFRGEFVPAPIYAGEALRPGNVVAGPAVIEGGATTVPVHPGQTVRVDQHLNLIMAV
ncbi:MAG TPA: hydantoinase/oxoprolinase family protein [Chloroflexota bacterium]